MGRLLTLLRKKGANFAPTDLPGLALWLDASDLSTITHDAGAVSQWDDKSGNARHATQGTAADQPTTGTRTMNGLNVLDLDGASDFMNTANPSLSTNGTWFGVFHSDNDTKWALLSTATKVLGIRESGASSTGIDFNITGVTHRAQGAEFGGTTLNQLWTASEPGPTVTAAVSVNINDAVTRLPANGGTTCFDGRVAEYLCWDRVLTADEIASVESYLASKWGVTLA